MRTASIGPLDNRDTIRAPTHIRRYLAGSPTASSDGRTFIQDPGAVGGGAGRGRHRLSGDGHPPDVRHLSSTGNRGTGIGAGALQPGGRRPQPDHGRAGRRLPGRSLRSPTGAAGRLGYLRSGDAGSFPAFLLGRAAVLFGDHGRDRLQRRVPGAGDGRGGQAGAGRAAFLDPGGDNRRRLGGDVPDGAGGAVRAGRDRMALELRLGGGIRVVDRGPCLRVSRPGRQPDTERRRDRRAVRRHSPQGPPQPELPAASPPGSSSAVSM